MVSIFHPWLEVREVGYLALVCELIAKHSAFVGLAVMLALYPVPKGMARLMSGVQKEKMKAVSCYIPTGLGINVDRESVDGCACTSRDGE